MTETARGTFTIVNAKGMHARAASKLVRLATGFASDVKLSGPEAEAVNGKSVMGVLLLCGSKGTSIDVMASGVDAVEAVAAIGAMIEDGFGESE